MESSDNPHLKDEPGVAALGSVIFTSSASLLRIPFLRTAKYSAKVNRLRRSGLKLTTPFYIKTVCSSQSRHPAATRIQGPSTMRRSKKDMVVSGAPFRKDFAVNPFRRSAPPNASSAPQKIAGTANRITAGAVTSDCQGQKSRPREPQAGRGRARLCGRPCPRECRRPKL